MEKKQTNIKTIPSAAGNSLVQAWTVFNREDDSIALWARPLATGDFSGNHFTVALRIECNKSVFNPLLIVSFRAKQKKSLPIHAVIKIAGVNKTKEIAKCQTEIVHSIVHKGLVSVFRFAIEEGDLLKLFKSDAKLAICFPDGVCTVEVNDDETLQFAQLKEQMAPNKLTDEQKGILSKEKERIKLQKSNERKEKVELDYKRREAIRVLSMSLSKGLIEEKDRIIAEKSVLSKYQLCHDSLGMKLYCSFRKSKLSQCIDNRVVDNLGLVSMKIPGETFLDDSVSFRDKDVDITLESIIGFLTHKRILSVVNDYAEKEYTIDPRISIQQAEEVVQNKKRYSELLNEWDSLEKLEKEEALIEKQEEEQKERQMASVRDIELRPDAKALAKHIFTSYRRNHRFSYVFHHPHAWEQYLPQFMDNKYLNEVEMLLESRSIIVWHKGSLGVVERGINPDLFKRCSVQHLYDIIDKKQTVEDVINNNAEKKGCYIATCVYGSYDCPEVWTLRRFRDNSLAQSWFGRLFIKSYYAVSPTLVKWFGQSEWFKTLWHIPLNYLVNNLHNRGVEDTPYQDKD